MTEESNKVVSLFGHTIKGAPDTDAIACLEGALEAAKAGELVSVAVCGVTSVGHVWTSYGSRSEATAFKQLAACSMLHHQWNVYLLTGELTTCRIVSDGEGQEADAEPDGDDKDV